MHNYFYQGHLVRKCLGQHFLQDQKIIEAIVSAIYPLPNQALVEIGPGLGALTKHIAKYVNMITVIELDNNLADYLAKHAAIQQKLNIILQDVMKVNFSDLSRQLGQPLRLFGNLPYNISIALIFYLFNHIHIIRDMYFMLQKEVVSRLLAQPNNKNYGRLSVIAQYYCQIDLVLDIPPESFRPVPKVDSAVVRLVPYVIPPYPVQNINKLYFVTSLAFQQRRKTIRNSLSKLFSVAQLSKLGILSTLRAENLSVEQYCCLARILV